MHKISTVVFEILQVKRNLNDMNLSHPEVCRIFVVVTGTALSTFSCISFVDSPPKLLFYIHFFVDETWLPAKIFMLSDICSIYFHIRSNARIMADKRDLVNLSES